MIKVKRIYDRAEKEDGNRYLVDRIWPRGVSKDEAKLTEWLKDLAPSDDLRKWFGHDPSKWSKFKQRYRAELQKDEKKELLEKLAREADQATFTLVYASKDTEHNNAQALKRFIQSML